MSLSLQGIAVQLPPKNINHSTEEYSQGSSMEPGDSSLPPPLPPSPWQNGIFWWQKKTVNKNLSQKELCPLCYWTLKFTECCPLVITHRRGLVNVIFHYRVHTKERLCACGVTLRIWVWELIRARTGPLEKFRACLCSGQSVESMPRWPAHCHEVSWNSLGGQISDSPACGKQSGISSNCSSRKMIQILQLWFLTHVMSFYWKLVTPVSDFPIHRNYIILIIYLYRVQKRKYRILVSYTFLTHPVYVARINRVTGEE